MATFPFCGVADGLPCLPGSFELTYGQSEPSGLGEYGRRSSGRRLDKEGALVRSVPSAGQRVAGSSASGLGRHPLPWARGREALLDPCVSAAC